MTATLICRDLYIAYFDAAGGVAVFAALLTISSSSFVFIIFV